MGAIHDMTRYVFTRATSAIHVPQWTSFVEETEEFVATTS